MGIGPQMRLKGVIPARIAQTVMIKPPVFSILLMHRLIVSLHYGCRTFQILTFNGSFTATTRLHSIPGTNKFMISGTTHTRLFYFYQVINTTGDNQ